MRAGLNGVMMGNFLTTLGNKPAEDREMFEELGLNVARQPDNGANPRPDNRSGWLEGDTPDVVGDTLRPPSAPPSSASASGIPRPSCGSPPSARSRPAPTERPTPAPRTCCPPDSAPPGPDPGPRGGVIELEARLDELRSLGLQRRTRLVSGPQGPHVVLDGKPVLLLCSNNYLGLADDRGSARRLPRQPCDGGSARARRAWSPGR